MEPINSGDRVVKALREVMHTIKHNVEQEFRKLNITGPQGMLMKTLSHHGEMKVSELSERMSLSNSTVSGIIDRLEKQGFVARTRSNKDKRVVYVSVTPAFKKEIQSRFDEIDKKVYAIMSEATAKEAEKVYEGLEILKELMDRQTKIQP